MTTIIDDQHGPIAFSQHPADCPECLSSEDRWRNEVAASGVRLRQATPEEYAANLLPGPEDV